MMSYDQDFELATFKLKEGVTNFADKDVEYYRKVKNISSEATIVVTRNDGTQDWY